eukprot:scaffold20255_cov64-Attheya_sp.AAC.6
MIPPFLLRVSSARRRGVGNTYAQTDYENLVPNLSTNMIIFSRAYNSQSFVSANRFNQDST